MCAIEAGKRGKRVLVLERNPQPGRKILISGGGRCNFTNIYCEPTHFLSDNPHFAKSALARFTPEDFIGMVRKHRIAYHEKKLGQLFCDGSAKQIVDLLLAECRGAGVRILTNIAITRIGRETEFVVETSGNEFRAPALVVATGGLSIPKMGATAFGYEIAKQFGLKIVPCRPALVPLVLRAEERAAYCDLAGVSADVVASCNGQSFRENMLITHRGLSGPAILQVSSYWRKPGEIVIDLLPESDATRLPQRLLNRWLEANGFAARRTITGLPDEMHGWRVNPEGTEGYAKAEVTAGGVDTDELSSKTMECKRVSGLYLIGEIVDVTGHLGGFNFQWAWSSGAAAGRSI